MPTPSRYWFVVPAAGIGQRMQSDIPKQYLTLSGKTVLEQTLQSLLQVGGFAGIVVALHPEDSHWDQLGVARHNKIHTVIGGAERSDSVLSALTFLQTIADEEDWVLVHDAARPCVCSTNIERMIEALSHDEVGGILATPASDTLKQVTEPPVIDSTLDRKQVWQAQTPQMFRQHLLRSALEQARDQSQAITDEASAIEFMGKQPKVFEGRRDNIKITHPDDLWLAELILQHKQS